MAENVVPEAGPTMHQIAQRAGVGKATVSLALRNDPRLRPETRQRIQKLAAKMGYHSNATVSNLMALLRVSRTPKYQATLGLLNVSPDLNMLTTLCTFREWVAGASERAVQLGYGLDRFWIHEPGISPRRLAEILESRNIRGLVVAALLDRFGLPSGFDPIWKHFACVVIGVRPARPALNFCSNDQFTTAFNAVQRLWEYGYRRIGLVISPDVDGMVDRRFSAGYWAGREAAGAPAHLHVPICPFHPARAVSFRAWYAQHKPDAILCINVEVKKWIEEMNIKVPEEVGLAHLDRNDDLPEWAGMHQNNTLIGAAGIDMLVGQLHRNEIGLPSFPKASLIESTWMDGPTIARRNVRKKGRVTEKPSEIPDQPAAA